MAAGVTIKTKRKAGAFSGGDLEAGELGVDTTNGKLYFSADGSAVIAVDLTPTGAVIWVAQNSAPSGYLKANGAAISRTTYSDLYAAIGTTFGSGDGSTTFDLPDLRGEFIRGWDDSRGIDSGRSFGSWQDHEIDSHNHLSGSNGDETSVNWNPYGYDGTVRWDGPSSGGAVGDAHYSSSTGGSETRPRNVALLACIKY